MTHTGRFSRVARRHSGNPFDEEAFQVQCTSKAIWIDKKLCENHGGSDQYQWKLKQIQESGEQRSNQIAPKEEGEVTTSAPELAVAAASTSSSTSLKNGSTATADAPSTEEGFVAGGAFEDECVVEKDFPLEGQEGGMFPPLPLDQETSSQTSPVSDFEDGIVATSAASSKAPSRLVGEEGVLEERFVPPLPLGSVSGEDYEAQSTSMLYYRQENQPQPMELEDPFNYMYDQQLQSMEVVKTFCSTELDLVHQH